MDLPPRSVGAGGHLGGQPSNSMQQQQQQQLLRQQLQQQQQTQQVQQSQQVQPQRQGAAQSAAAFASQGVHGVQQQQQQQQYQYQHNQQQQPQQHMMQSRGQIPSGAQHFHQNQQQQQQMQYGQRQQQFQHQQHPSSYQNSTTTQRRPSYARVMTMVPANPSNNRNNMSNTSNMNSNAAHGSRDMGPARTRGGGAVGSRGGRGGSRGGRAGVERAGSARKKKKSLAEDKLMGEHAAFFEEMEREEAAPREKEEPLIETILGRRLREDYDPELEEEGDEDDDADADAESSSVSGIPNSSSSSNGRANSGQGALLESVEVQTPTKKKKAKTRRELLEEEDERRRVEQDKFEFLVKWRGKSYLHADWVSPDLIDLDVNGSQRLKRFVNTLPSEQEEASANSNRGREEIEYFDPTFVEVDRILDESKEDDPQTQAKRTPSWIREATQILSKIINYRRKGTKFSMFFMEPVDEERDGAPGYHEMIAQPMDFGTIHDRLLGGHHYNTMDDFAKDMRLVFANCRIYNTDPELFVRECSEKLSEIFEQKFGALKASQAELNEKDKGALYLVKWKNMSYADSTWERATDILDDHAIAAYRRRSKIPAAKRQAVQSTNIENKINTERSVLAQQQDLHRRRVTEHLESQRRILRQRQEGERQELLERQRREMQQQQAMYASGSNGAPYQNFPPNFQAYMQQLQQSHKQQQDRLVQAHSEQERQFTLQQQQHIQLTNNQLQTQNQQLEQRHQQLRAQMQQNEEVDNEAVAAAAEGHHATSSSGSRFFKYTESPAFKDGLRLRSYQLEGLNWLAFNYANNRGSLLADEMGLGKTCQTVSFVRHLKLHGNPPNRPALVVAPLSTLGHWRNEFERWTDLNCVLYHDGGNRKVTGSAARALIREHEFYYWRKNSKTGVATAIPNLYKFDVIVTSYEALSADGPEFAGIKWSGVIVDEGHRLKSKKSKLAQTFADFIKADVRVILTGTPLQNNVGELWALLNFIEPKEFPDREDFLEHFGDMQNAEQVQALQARVKPYMLRRLKEHVEKDIPAKEETVIDVELTNLQKKYYRAIFERNREFLGGGPGVVNNRNGVSPQLISIEMELRKCCNHPFLISGVEQREALTGDIKYESEEYLQQMIQASGKMVLLDKLLDKLRKEGRKVLIFSQFKMMLDIISDYCAHPCRQYPLERIDGNVSGNARQKAIDRFSDPESKSFVFLLSTRAGGVGINLTAADTVIIFDSDWNPQNDLQAMARCHRIGQKKSVNVYRFVTRLTYESHLFDRAAKKLGLEQAVLGRQGSSAVAEPASKEEIEELLKYGAYRLLEDDEEAAKKQKEYSEANIDDLLTNSRKVNWDKAGANPDGNNGFSFSKASFVAAGTDQEIDVQDPKFWTKVLGEDPRSTMLARLMDGSACETEEKKQAFFLELRVVGHQVIDEKLKGNATPDFEQEIINCLEMFKDLKRTFNSREQAAADQMLQQIKRPSRRNYDVSKIKTFFDGERLPGMDEPAPVQAPEKVASDGEDDDANDDDYQGSSSNNKKPRRFVEVDGRKVEMLIIQGKWIDPEILRQTVEDFGGYEKVVVERLWQSIRRKLELRETSSCGHQIHKAYKKYFYPDPDSMPVVDVEEARRQKKIEKEKRQQEETADRKRRRSDVGTKRTSARSAKKAKKSRNSSAASITDSVSAKPKRTEPEVKIEIFEPKVYEDLDAEGKPWCRYCGAIETSSWSRGPWGPQTLCIAHYSQHYQKKSLDLSEYEEMPKQPINPETNTQFRYLARKKAKEDKRREYEDLNQEDDDEGDNMDLEDEEEEDDDLDSSGFPRRRMRRTTRLRTTTSRRRSAAAAERAMARAAAEEDEDKEDEDEEDEDEDKKSTSKNNENDEDDEENGDDEDEEEKRPKRGRKRKAVKRTPKKVKKEARAKTSDDEDADENADIEEKDDAEAKDDDAKAKDDGAKAKDNDAEAKDDDAKSKDDDAMSKDDDAEANDGDVEAKDDEDKAKAGDDQAKDDDAKAKDDNAEEKSDDDKAKADDDKAKSDDTKAKADDDKAKSDDTKAKADDTKAKDDDAKAKDDDAKSKDDDAKSKDDDAKAKDDDTKAKDDDAKAKDDDAKAKDDDARAKDDDAKAKDDDAKSKDDDAKAKDDDAKAKDDDAKAKDDDAKAKDDDAKAKDDDAKAKDDDAKAKDDDAKAKDDDAKAKDDDAKAKDDDAKAKDDDAKAKDDDAKAKDDDARAKDDDAKAKDDDAKAKDDDAKAKDDDAKAKDDDAKAKDDDAKAKDNDAEEKDDDAKAK